MTYKVTARYYSTKLFRLRLHSDNINCTVGGIWQYVLESQHSLGKNWHFISLYQKVEYAERDIKSITIRRIELIREYIDSIIIDNSYRAISQDEI